MKMVKDTINLKLIFTFSKLNSGSFSKNVLYLNLVAGCAKLFDTSRLKVKASLKPPLKQITRISIFLSCPVFPLYVEPVLLYPLLMQYDHTTLMIGKISK